MKKLLMFLIIILLACPLYAQQELDQNSDDIIDHELGGTGNASWAAGEIPYCSIVTGSATTGTGVLDGIPNFIYDAVTHNRLECTQANPPYFENGIDMGDSTNARWTFLDTECDGSDKEIGYFEIDEDGVGGDGTEYGDILLYSMENGTENQRMMYDASEGAWITTKGFAGGKYIIPDANGRTIGATEAYGAVHVATGPGTWILPDECDTATGANICLYQTGADEVIIDLPAEDNFVYEGTPETDGEAMDSTAAAGEYICVYCLVANEWHVMEHTTGWTGE